MTPERSTDAIRRGGWWAFLGVLAICTAEYWTDGVASTKASAALKLLCGIVAVWAFGFVSGHNARSEDDPR